MMKAGFRQLYRDAIGTGQQREVRLAVSKNIDQKKSESRDEKPKDYGKPPAKRHRPSGQRERVGGKGNLFHTGKTYLEKYNLLTMTHDNYFLPMYVHASTHLIFHPYIRHNPCISLKGV